MAEMKVRICVEVARRSGNSYEVKATCEGGRGVCALLQRLKEGIARMVVEGIRFVERLRSAW